MIFWFRVDASLEIGTGHLMRCLALAEACSELDIECRFIVRSSSVPFCKERHEWSWKLIELPVNCNIAAEQTWIQRQCNFSHNDMLILDGYQFSKSYINKLQDLHIPVILFDDNNNRGKLEVQLVINGATNGSELGYELTMPNAKHCLGDKYRLLRREFRSEIPQTISQRHSIAIIMGGADTRQLILPLLKELQAQKNETPVRVIVSRNYSQMDALKRTISSCDYAVQLIVNGTDLANVFNNAKLVISAGGGTQFELLAMHTPSLLLSVADNQLNASRQSQKQGWSEHIDCVEKAPISKIVARVHELIYQPKLLEFMQSKAELYADTQGVERLVDALLELPLDA